MPASYRLPHAFQSLRADCRSEVGINPPLFVDTFPGFKAIPQKGKFGMVMISLPVYVFAVDDTGFAGMDFQPALNQPSANFLQSLFSLCLAFAMHYAIIGIAA